jgi:hypothetical protein
MYDIVSYIALNSCGTREVWEFCEEIIRGRAAAYGFDARDCCRSSLRWCGQRSGAVEEPVIFAVDQ